MNERSIRFKPSVAAIQRSPGNLFIVSSVNQMLVIAASSDRIMEVYPLDRGLFKQPEGIMLTDKGDLIISNEAAGEGPANLLVFVYRGENM